MRMQRAVDLQDRAAQQGFQLAPVFGRLVGVRNVVHRQCAQLLRAPAEHL
jgi:hypothetical protein